MTLKLPEVYEAISIENYSVLDAGGDGNVLAVGKILHELLASFKHVGVVGNDKKVAE